MGSVMCVKSRMSENSTASLRLSPFSMLSGLLIHSSMTSFGTYFWKMLRIFCSRLRATAASRAYDLIWP